MCDKNLNECDGFLKKIKNKTVIIFEKDYKTIQEKNKSESDFIVITPESDLYFLSFFPYKTVEFKQDPYTVLEKHLLINYFKNLIEDDKKEEYVIVDPKSRIFKDFKKNSFFYKNLINF